MSFLSSTAQIDSILTKKGRELLSKGQFNPSKFCLADDPIDYGLLAYEDGEAQILATKILEASSLGQDSDTELKYKLIINPDSTFNTVPQLSIMPISVIGTVYQIFIVKVVTINGIDTSYTINNPNSSLSIYPETALYYLNQQKYIAQSGKSHNQLYSQLYGYKNKYGDLGGTYTANTYPENNTSRQVGNDTEQSFFVFANEPFSSALSITVQGNNSGAVGTFSVTNITVT